MRYPLFALALAVPVQASAQAAYDPYSSATNIRPTVLTVPQPGARQVVTAGEPILDQRNGRLALGAIVDASFDSPPKVANSFQTKPGDPFFRVGSRAAFKVCSARLGPEGWPPCFLDDDGDGLFDRVASNDVRKAHPIGKPVPYHRETVLLPAAASGFTRSILYQGATTDTLRLSYREFKDDLARPAFEESLSIPLTKDFPQKVAAKGAVFTIYRIDGLGLDYQVENAGSFAVAP